MLDLYVLLFIGTLHAVYHFSDVTSLKCHSCDERVDAKKCMDLERDEMVQCINATTCIIAAGIRKLKQNGVMKMFPAMARACSRPNAVVHDATVWVSAKARGLKMVCRFLTRPLTPEWINAGAGGAVDRRCVCGEDSCNNKIWDDVMVQPVLPAKPAPDEIPAIPTLGSNAVDSILKQTFPTSQSSTESGLPVTSTVESLTTSTGTESGGTSTGLIAGVAVGAVIFLALLAGLIYWLKFRKPDDPESETTVASGASADPEAGEDDEVFAPAET